MQTKSETPIPVSAALLASAAERLAAVRRRIADAAGRTGRDPDRITLVGVAKRQPLDRILATIRSGLQVLGENYVQEARDTRARIEAEQARDATGPRARLQWRMVGRLQRNKLAEAVRIFDAIESLDRIELVAPLARHARARAMPLDVLVQVNLGDEPQKGGAPWQTAPDLARAIAAEPALRLCGLMGVAPASDDPQAGRPYYRMLREARDEWARDLPALAGGDLSMGMSADFEVAIEEGATLVRVGTALFGERVGAATDASGAATGASGAGGA